MAFGLAACGFGGGSGWCSGRSRRCADLVLHRRGMLQVSRRIVDTGDANFFLALGDFELGDAGFFDQIDGFFSLRRSMRGFLPSRYFGMGLAQDAFGA